MTMNGPSLRPVGSGSSGGISPRALGVLALAVVIGVITFAALGGSSKAKTAATTSTTSEVTSDGTSVSPVAAATTVPGLPPLPEAPKPMPAGGLYEGRPPMFIMVSFDGAADQSLLAHWEDVMKRSQAHMTLFLSAVYMLGQENKDAYRGPRHAAGESGINFAPTLGKPTTEFLTSTVNGLHDAQLAGHELENHYAGHWCGPSGVNSWNKADWAAEINQFDDLTRNIDKYNKLDPPVGNPLLRPPIGSRTPCLEGNLDQLYPVLKARGYRYDASKTRTLSEWPVQKNGLWTFGFPGVAIEGLSKPMLTVDFTLRENMDPKHDADEATAKDISRRVYEGYKKAFNDLYYGTRAPFEVSNHFVHFSREAYNLAIEKLLTEVCPMAEVQCVNYREATDWLDAHKDSVNSYEKGSFPKLARPAGV
jgi:peptidoglycan/xylan/chitin deacetylase (PgdA/CDA1 family)